MKNKFKKGEIYFDFADAKLAIWQFASVFMLAFSVYWHILQGLQLKDIVHNKTVTGVVRCSWRIGVLQK